MQTDYLSGVKILSLKELCKILLDATIQTKQLCTYLHMTSMEQVKSTIYVDNPCFWSRSLQFAKLVHQNMFQIPTSFVCKNISSNATCHHYLLLLLLLLLLVSVGQWLSTFCEKK